MADLERLISIRESNAAIRAGGIVLTPQRRALSHYFAALAAIRPALTINFIQPGSRSFELVGADNAFSFRKARTVVGHPLRTDRDMSTLAHELGHCRTEWVGKLESELAAWQWAVRHAPFWSRECEADMLSALSSYLGNAKQEQTLAVIAIERFLAEGFEGRARTWTPPTVAALDQAEFNLEFGEHPCAIPSHRGRPEPAAYVRAGAFACLMCATDADVRTMRAEQTARAEGRARTLVLKRDFELKLQDEAREREIAERARVLDLFRRTRSIAAVAAAKA